MRLFSKLATAFALAWLCACLGAARAQQQPENIPQENSDAVARAMAGGLLERQTGAAVPADKFWAYEVDFNLDGLSEIYAYVADPACDGVKCGLFLFVLEGDGYREVLGDIPGARLTPPDRVALGAFKRNGFIDLQLDQKLFGWTGDHYAEVSTFPATSLDGTAFIAACQKANPASNLKAARPNGSPVSANASLTGFKRSASPRPTLTNMPPRWVRILNIPTAAKRRPGKPSPRTRAMPQPAVTWSAARASGSRPTSIMATSRNRGSISTASLLPARPRISS